MHLVSYFNPLSDQFHAYVDFQEKLAIDQKIKTIAITILATACSFFILGLGGLAAFRLMVAYYTFKNLDEKKPEEKPIETPEPQKKEASKQIETKPIETPEPQKKEVVEVPPSKQTTQKSSMIGTSVLAQIIEPEKNQLTKSISHSPSITVSDANKDIPESTSPIKLRPFLTKQRTRNYSADEKLAFANLPLNDYKIQIEQLDEKNIDAFWAQISQYACGAKNTEETNLSIVRLITILENISDENFEMSVQLNSFWKIFANNRFYREIILKFQPKHFGLMTATVRLLLIDGEVLFLDDYKESERTLKKLIGVLRSNIDSKTKLLEYLAQICPHATPNLESEIDAIIRNLPETAQKMEIKAKWKQALKTYSSRDRSNDPSTIKLRASEKACKRRTAKEPERSKTDPITFKETENSKEVEKHVVSLGNDVCSQYLNGYEELNQIPREHQEDVFFWLLQNMNDLHVEKRKKFVQDYFSGFTSPEQFTFLENFTDIHLKTFVTLLDRNGLENLWKKEKCAASKYIGNHSIDRLRSRLRIELTALSQSQLSNSLIYDSFWSLLTGLDYKKTFAESFTSEQFGWFAQWIENYSNDTSIKIKERALWTMQPVYFWKFISELGYKGSIRKSVTEENIKIGESLLKSKMKEIETDFCGLINLMSKDTPEQVATLQRNALAILPHSLNHPNILQKLESMLGGRWVRNEIKAIRDKELAAEKERQEIAALEAAVAEEEALLAQEKEELFRDQQEEIQEEVIKNLAVEFAKATQQADEMQIAAEKEREEEEALIAAIAAEEAAIAAEEAELEQLKKEEEEELQNRATRNLMADFEKAADSDEQDPSEFDQLSESLNAAHITQESLEEHLSNQYLDQLQEGLSNEPESANDSPTKKDSILSQAEEVLVEDSFKRALQNIATIKSLTD